MHKAVSRNNYPASHFTQLRNVAGTEARSPPAGEDGVPRGAAMCAMEARLRDRVKHVLIKQFITPTHLLIFTAPADPRNWVHRPRRRGVRIQILWGKG